MLAQAWWVKGTVVAHNPPHTHTSSSKLLYTPLPPPPPPSSSWCIDTSSLPFILVSYTNLSLSIHWHYWHQGLIYLLGSTMPEERPPSWETIPLQRLLFLTNFPFSLHVCVPPCPPSPQLQGISLFWDFEITSFSLSHKFPLYQWTLNQGQDLFVKTKKIWNPSLCISMSMNLWAQTMPLLKPIFLETPSLHISMSINP